MPFVPNTADAGFAAQAAPQAWDFDQLVLSYGMTGVQGTTGCAVTAQGSPDMTVAVSAGTVRIRGRKVTVTGGNVTITAADATNPRFDLITVDTTGAKAAVAGTPAATSPVVPATPANRVALATVYVPANDTAINTNQITDKRSFWLPPMGEDIRWYGAAWDGTTDDKAAIDAAIAAIGTTNRGTILYPAGTGRSSGGHILYSRHQHVGIGRRTTILELANTANPVAMFITDGFAGLVDGQTGGGPLQFGIRHMTLEGNKANQTAVVRSRPPAPTASTSTTGGTLAASTYVYRLSAINALGETIASDEVYQTTTGATSTITLNWSAVTGATGYRIYGRTWPGTRMVTLGAVTTWLDDGSVTPSATPFPERNSTATAGICIYGYDYQIDDVAIKNFPGEGFFSKWGALESDGTTDTVGWDFMDATISRMKVSYCGADGFIWGGPHDSTIRDVNAFFNGHQDWSINFDLRGGGYSSVFTACHAYGDSLYAWRTGGNYLLNACVGEGCKGAQLQIIGDNLRVLGGQWFAGGSAFPSAIGISMGWSGYQPKNTRIDGPFIGYFQFPGTAVDFTYAGVNCFVRAVVEMNPPQTTTTGAMTNVQTTVPVTSGSGLANGDSIVVDNERMLITAGGGTTTLTVTRATGGTTAAAHLSGALVTEYWPAYLGTIDEGSDVELFITGTSQKVTPSFKKFESNVGLRSTDFGFADSTMVFKNATQTPTTNPPLAAQLYASSGTMWQRNVNGAVPVAVGFGEMTFWTDRTVGAVAVAEQGLNVPAAVTEWDATFAGTRLIVNCDEVGPLVALAVNFREVAHAGGANSYQFSIRDTSNTANILASVTQSASGPANFQAVSAYAAKPAWAVGTKTLALYTSGGDGADDIILRSLALRWKA